MFNVDDLPDSALFEILCRLPCKYAVRSMCVSKRWFNLVSSSYFVTSFLRLQSENHKPDPTATIIFVDPYDSSKFFPTTKILSSLRFLPFTTDCQPVIVGAYNDLILCFVGWQQREFYLCNPYTKQWDALPCPQLCADGITGFVCDDPYYYKKQDGKEVTFKVNPNYRYRILRLIPREWEFSFNLKTEIFSSETRKWTESIMLSPRAICLADFTDFTGCRPKYWGVAYNGKFYNGKLYWGSYINGLVIGVDPYSDSNKNSNNKYNVTIIDKPDTGKPQNVYFKFLGLSSRGCLRRCQVDNQIAGSFLSVWDLVDDEEEDKEDDQIDKTGKWRLVGEAELYQMILEDPVLRTWHSNYENIDFEVLNFDPTDDDILYLELDKDLVQFNIRAKTLTETRWSEPYYDGPSNGAFPFVLPWWPTPVTSHKPKEEDIVRFLKLMV